jgi:xanthine dehydrogenase D subunit
VRAETTVKIPERTVPDTEGIGTSATRPDAAPKVKGQFAYSSDLWAEGMLWGATVRSPHARAHIKSIDRAGAAATTGVHAVLTHEDVPGRKTFGLEIADQPVLAWNTVRYQGEAIAVVAADHPETARRAAAKVSIDYDVLEPVSDADAALEAGAPELHDSGNTIRYVRIRRGDASPEAEVVVTGDYEVGMQDQAFLGPESGLAVPDGEGGVDLYISTQWLHVDRDQLAASLALPPDKVRLTLAGVGGAFGAREDLSIQIHCCLLALRTGRPVKMMYGREESFFGHVHRHPARLHYEHGAARDGRLVYIKARIVLDGGAYASSSTAVVSNASCFACGPYEVPNVSVDGLVVYTNNPPCGAMRGFGAVQSCFAYEAQMDRVAAELSMDPVELRIRNALKEGSVLPTGQRVRGPAPVAKLLETVRDMAEPDDIVGAEPDLRTLPGGVSNSTHGEGLRRGRGFAVGFKNICYSEGFDDHASARVILYAAAGEAVVEIHSAAAEVGQGINTIQAQIARSELGVARAVVLPADTTVGSSGSSSASRQTWMTGGAVKTACEAVRARVLERAARQLGVDADGLRLEKGKVLSKGAGPVASLAGVLGDEVVEETRTYRHRKTFPLDPETGQGDAHVAFAFAAHRAVVEVDVELGLVKVLDIATAQDVGKALNPQAVEGQIEGGIAQGLGLALMEEIQLRDSKIQNPSFTDYLIPTILDMPKVRAHIFELGDPDSPYGIKGVGEPPTISSTPAIVAAVRAATDRELARVPLRPDDVVGLPIQAAPTSP